MVNEDIITSLRNAVAKGETLESAMQTAIASGYNARDVQEASRYIGAGTLHMEKASQDRILTMPNQKKGFFSGLFSKKQPKQEVQSAVQYQSQSSQIPPAPQPNTNRMQTPSQDMSFSSIPLPAQTKQPEIKTQIPRPIAMQRPSPQPPPKPIPQPIQQIYQQPAPQQTPQPYPKQYQQPMPQPLPQNYSYSSERIPKKQGYAKEIILLIMLLILAAVLIITFRYRTQIVAFFSG